jgi:hypothetical protein
MVPVVILPTARLQVQNMGDNDKAALMQQLEVMQMKDSLKYVPSISPSPPDP